MAASQCAGDGEPGLRPTELPMGVVLDTSRLITPRELGYTHVTGTGRFKPCQGAPLDLGMALRHSATPPHRLAPIPVTAVPGCATGQTHLILSTLRIFFGDFLQKTDIQSRLVTLGPQAPFAGMFFEQG
jgi:hypothetical protein